MLDDTIGGAAVLDSGGDVSTGVENSTATAEISTDSGADSTQVSDISTQTAENSTEQQQQAQGFDPTGKPSPQTLRAGLEKLGEIDKRLPDYFRKNFFKVEQYEREGTLQEFRNLKENFTALGGEEGIEQLQQERQEYARELTMFAEGNPQLLDDLIADSKDGFVKLAPEAFDRLRGIDPALYNSVALGGFSEILKSSGFPDGLSTLAAGAAELVDHIQNGRQQEAFNASRNLAAWMAKFKEMAGAGRPRVAEPDERMKKIEEKEQNLARTEENNYRQSVNSQLNSEIIKPILNKALAPLMKGRALTVPQKQRLETMIYNDITREVQSDKRFQDKRRALGERHDTKGLMNLFRPRMEEIIPKVVKSVWSDSGFGSAPRPAANGNGAAQIQVGQKPNADDIDWSKDRNRNRFMHGEATLKNGKIARWKWDNV